LAANLDPNAVMLSLLIIRPGVTYRAISNHLGSPRLIVDASTGTVAQRLDYDEFDAFTTLSAAYGANAYVGRSFWQYYPKGNSAYNSKWLTRGLGGRPPYSVGDEAARKLALPPWNPGTAVREVPNSWRFFAGGPGRVPPAYGQPGGGAQYLVGGWPK
jgi:hypothetical protein